jgi:hypothetical protein
MKLFNEHDNGSYTHNDNARRVRHEFVNLVRGFIKENEQYSLVDLRLLLGDALNDATIQESIYRRLT